MKKILLLIALSLVARTNWAQSCPNGDFENWYIRPYVVPDSGWYDSNPGSLALSDTLTVWSVTGVSGLAVHIQTAIIGTDTNQAYIINTLGDPKTGTGGVPYSQQPTSINGYYRYNLPGNDSALLLVMFKKAGVVVSNQWIKFRGTGSMSTFTAFSFPVSVSVIPDTVILGASSSNVQGVGIQSGSWLELDELSFGGPGITQPIPGGTFDHFLTQSYDKPNGWAVSPYGNGNGNVARTTDHYSGNYAVALTTQSGGSGSANAVISTGHFPQNSGPAGGLPYTHTTDTLCGYYKYTTTGTDTAAVGITITAAGSMVGGNFTYLWPASAWTYFSVPLNTISTPDTLRIDFQSSSWTGGVAGSQLIVDYVQLKSAPLPPVWISSTNFIDPVVSAYPNPATDVLNVTMINSLASFDVLLYNTEGRILCTRYGITGNTSVSVALFAPGLYFYEVRCLGNVVRGKWMKQ